MANEELINIREAARQCGRNPETVRRWIWSGKLPAEKLGNQLFIKKEDLASFCRETAVAYRAEKTLDFLERPQALRNETHARTGRVFDAEEMARQIREEHMNETEPRTTMVTGEHRSRDNPDFIERAIRFQNKLRARGYPEMDTAALVRKSREGRMREIRQSLRRR